MVRDQRHTRRSTSGARALRPSPGPSARSAGAGSGAAAPARRGRWRSWVAELTVLSLLAFAVAAYRFDLGERWFDLGPDPATEPARVLPPEGLRLPAPPQVDEVAAGGPVVAADPALVAAALAPELDVPELGPRFSVLVSDASSGEEVFRDGAPRVIPASTTKVLTGVAALESLGAQRRFATSVRWLPEEQQLVLVGGGDPYLERSPQDAEGAFPERADLRTLAEQTATALAAARETDGAVGLGFDDGLFAGPAFNPTWPATYDDIVSPISALWVDQARQEDGTGFAEDPSLQAARAFAQELRAQGVPVRGAPRREAAPAGPEATEQPGESGESGESPSAEPETLAEVESAPVALLVEQMMATSDNQAAEVLAHHVGLAVQGEGSFLAGAASTLEVLRGLGVSGAGDVLFDGSGLSRDNLLAPATIAAAVRLAEEEDRPELRAVLTGLPVAGFSGSLAGRFEDEPAQARGRVRAKTGTLTGVHGLAGVVEDGSGARMTFVMVADRVRDDEQLDARLQVDRVAAALAACTCGVGS